VDEFMSKVDESSIAMQIMFKRLQKGRDSKELGKDHHMCSSDSEQEQVQEETFPLTRYSNHKTGAFGFAAPDLKQFKKRSTSILTEN
jgi:hypothetical protein